MRSSGRLARPFRFRDFLRWSVCECPMDRCFGCLVVLMLTAGGAWAQEKLTLSTSGKSDYVIVVSAKATSVERTAARELQKHLLEVTGAELPMATDTDVSGDVPRIVVGDNPLTRKLLGGCDPAGLPPDAIIMKAAGRDLVLVGHPRRGTLYAVFTFLEDLVGVRWWTPNATYIPKRQTLIVTAPNVTYAPKLVDRATRYLVLHDEAPAADPGKPAS